MTTAIRRFATKESTIEAIQWGGSDASTREVKEWGGDKVKVTNDVIFYQASGHWESLLVGNYLVDISGSLLSFTPKELEEDYFPVCG